MDRCDIVMPVWNQLEATRQCIESILKNTRYPYRLIIIDNGSENQTKDYLESLKYRGGMDIVLLRSNENLGFVKAVNHGIKTSDARYVCIMNNDTVATNGWLEELIKTMELHPRLGILNPSSNTSGQFPAENESVDSYALKLKGFSGQIQELSSCRGFCMLIKRQVIDKIGLFDEIYNIGYFEETDYCRRAYAESFASGRAKASYVYHKEGITFKGLENQGKIFKQNEAIFFKRYGRPVRVGYFVDAICQKDKIDGIARDVARSGNQILIFIKRGLKWPVSIDHFDIRKSELNSIFFGLASLYKILKRKKKKRLNMLLTDDKVFGRFLQIIKMLHGADVVINPDTENLIALVKKKSRLF